MLCFDFLNRILSKCLRGYLVSATKACTSRYDPTSFDYAYTLMRFVFAFVPLFPCAKERYPMTSTTTKKSTKVQRSSQCHLATLYRCGISLAVLTCWKVLRRQLFARIRCYALCVWLLEQRNDANSPQQSQTGKYSTRRINDKINTSFPNFHSICSILKVRFVLSKKSSSLCVLP